MKSRTDKGVRNQVGLSLVEQVGQRLLPLVSGIAATKQGLLEWVHDFGLKALDELMRDDAARIVGAKGKHRTDRTHHYWGKTRSELTFGGRRISVEKPRVRSKDGREASSARSGRVPRSGPAVGARDEPASAGRLDARL